MLEYSKYLRRPEKFKISIAFLCTDKIKLLYLKAGLNQKDVRERDNVRLKLLYYLEIEPFFECTPT